MFKHIYPALISCIFLTTSWGQSFSVNPFSSLGIGETEPLVEARFGGVGSAVSAVYDSVSINTFNPASYAFLSKGLPLFGISFAANLSDYSQNGTSNSARMVGITNFTLAIPIKNKFGLTFGLKPYSRKGYSFRNYSLIGADSVENSYIGSGSTQNAFLGFSYAPINSKKMALSFGFNSGYIFGRVLSERKAKYISTSTSGAEDIVEVNLNSFHVSLGALYRYSFCAPKNQPNINRSKRVLNHQFTLGVTYEPQQLLAAKRTYGLYFADEDVDDLNDFDTILFESNISGTIVNPTKLSLGFSYIFKPLSANRAGKLVYSLSVYGNYTSLKSSTYAESFATTTTSAVYSDASTTSFGVEFLPKSKNDTKSLKFDYIKRVQYRVGFTQQSFGFSYNLTPYVQNSFTTGLGLPIGGANSNSRLNLSAQYGKRTAGTGSIEQSIWSFGVGIIVSPSGYDSWFRKYKLD